MSVVAELEVLECASCGARVPLVEASETRCSHCDRKVVLPKEHTEALRAANEGQATRVLAAERLMHLARGPSENLAWIGGAAIIVLPSLVTYLLASRPELGWSQIELTLNGALPATLPGVWLYLWSAATAGTHARFCDALSANPPVKTSGPMTCRICGAPLAAPEVTHVMRCPYCGSDNLLREVKLDGLLSTLRSNLRTLEQAGRLLTLRKALWGTGIAAACGLVLAFLLLVRVMVG